LGDVNTMKSGRWAITNTPLPTGTSLEQLRNFIRFLAGNNLRDVERFLEQIKNAASITHLVCPPTKWDHGFTTSQQDRMPLVNEIYSTLYEKNSTLLKPLEQGQWTDKINLIQSTDWMKFKALNEKEVDSCIRKANMFPNKDETKFGKIDIIRLSDTHWIHSSPNGLDVTAMAPIRVFFQDNRNTSLWETFVQFVKDDGVKISLDLLVDLIKKRLIDPKR